MPLPEVVFRDFVPGKSLSEINAPYYRQHMFIKIPSYSISKGGFFSSDYSLYLVETSVDNQRFRVQRRDTDFYFLRRMLRAQFPYVLVPPLPKPNKKLVEKVLNRQQRFFQRFMQSLTKSDVLRSSEFFSDFLTVKDLKLWEQSIKKHEKTKFVKNINDFVTENGEVNV